MTDQHNARALGCYGNSEIQTPNIDALAADGVTFDNAITPCPQCRPARYSILSGLYPRTHGLRANKDPTPTGLVAWTKAFRSAGYEVATIGKHHMFEDVEAMGFDTIIGKFGEDHAQVGGYKNKKNPRKILQVGAISLSTEDHRSGRITQAAMDFIDRQGEKPFCLVISHFGPHGPICPSRSWADLYDPNELTLPANHRTSGRRIPMQTKLWASKFGLEEDDHRYILSTYYGLVSQIDHYVGNIIDHIKALGSYDNTIILFCADHGEYMSEHESWTKNSTGYEAISRIPFIWRVPSLRSHGVRRSQLASSLDILPTLLDCLNLPSNGDLQGSSLLPIMRDAHISNRQFDVMESLSSGDKIYYSRAVRTENIKYFRVDHPDHEVEEFLFDLQADPLEMQDLSRDTEWTAELDRCRHRLEKWETDIPISNIAG